MLGSATGSNDRMLSVQWEAHQEIVPVQPQNIQATCEAAGRDGWELRAMLPIMVQPVTKLIQPNGPSLPPQTAVVLQFQRPIGWKPNEVEADELNDPDPEDESTWMGPET